MSATREPLQRLEQANPYPTPADVDGTRWGREVLHSVIADGAPSPAAPRRRGVGRRGLMIALAGTLLVGGGATLAAIAIDREAPEPVQRSVRAALDLPAPDRAALTPVPHGIREAFRAQTPYGTWVIDTIQTRGRGTLVTDGVPHADGALSVGIGGCPPIAPGGAAIAWCGAATNPLGPGSAPALRILGRVSDHVRRVEMRGPDGAVVPGWTDGGFFLVLIASQPPPGTLRLVAIDASGAEIGAEALRTTADLTLPVPARP